MSQPSRWKVIYRNIFCAKFVTPLCVITNQCAAHSCSFTCTFFVLWRSFDNNGGKRAGKFIGVYFCGKACSKNYSSLERIDSRVQYIWRLQVMGSWLYSLNDLSASSNVIGLLSWSNRSKSNKMISLINKNTVSV